MNVYAFMGRDWHACPHRGLYEYVRGYACIRARAQVYACGCAGLLVCVQTCALKRGLLSLVAGCAGGEFSSSWTICPFQSWGQVWLSGCLPKSSRAESGSPISLPPSSTQPRSQPPRNDRLPSPTLASITAEKKVPKSSAGWRQKRHQKTSSCQRP